MIIKQRLNRVMKSGVEILNELNALSPRIAGILKVNVFSVPVGYFEKLTVQILNTAKQEEQGLINPGIITMPLQVPQGYFDTLAGTILNRIKKQEEGRQDEEEISSMINAIPKKNVYEVPVNYFENLAVQIIEKTTVKTGKLVAFTRRNNFVKYAVAAAFIGVISFGAVKFINTAKPTAAINYTDVMKTNIDGELAKISDDEIVNFLTKEGVDVDAAVAVTQMQDKIDTEEFSSDKTENSEIDDLLNQLEENKTMN